MTAWHDRKERARLGARSAARDLLRFVRALKARGVDLATLDEDERDALDQCNQDLANALAAVEEPHAEAMRHGASKFLAEVEKSVAATRALFHATRASILERLGARRREVLEAMLAVVVTDDDLAVESVNPVSDDELGAARQRAERRLAQKRRAEARRRRVEAQALDLDAPLEEHLASLPSPWFRAVARAVGDETTRDPAYVAARLSSAPVLAGVLATLRPRDRRALAALLEADGVVLARVFEARHGDVTEDGWDWAAEPPTSVVGRLRSRGLCFVGRSSLGLNPRSRPRVVVVPRDLRAPLSRALAETPAPPPIDPTVSAEIVDVVMERPAAATAEDAEVESVEFDRAQPELAGFAAAAAESVESAAATGAVIFYVERVWAAYEAAHGGRVPRLRAAEVERARRESDAQLAALAVMHERLLERRVSTLMAVQPHLYSYLAGALEELPIEEADRAIVFHACDTAIRAFDAALT